MIAFKSQDMALLPLRERKFSKFTLLVATFAAEMYCAGSNQVVSQANLSISSIHLQKINDFPVTRDYKYVIQLKFS